MAPRPRRRTAACASVLALWLSMALVPGTTQGTPFRFLASVQCLPAADGVGISCDSKSAASPSHDLREDREPLIEHIDIANAAHQSLAPLRLQ